MDLHVDEELNYLDDLLKDFGLPKYKGKPREAQKVISARFDSLNEQFEGLFKYLFPNEFVFNEKMPSFAVELHGYLYKGILSIAGNIGRGVILVKAMLVLEGSLISIMQIIRISTPAIHQKTWLKR